MVRTPQTVAAQTADATSTSLRWTLTALLAMTFLAGALAFSAAPHRVQHAAAEAEQAVQAQPIRHVLARLDLQPDAAAAVGRDRAYSSRAASILLAAAP